MILTIAIVVYAISVLISTRILAGHLAWKWKSQFVERPEALDWLGGACFGLLGSLVWPGLLVVRAARQLELPAVGAEREAREDQHTREAELRRATAAEHVAELERNLDPTGSAED